MASSSAKEDKGERELASPYIYAASATDLSLYDRGYQNAIVILMA